MNFLTRDNLYETEKPYQLRYNPEEGTPKTNLRLEKQNALKISSMRGREQQFSLERNGFAVLKLDNEIPYEAFGNPKGIQSYLDVVCQSLKVHLGADRVQAYQYLVSMRLRIVLGWNISLITQRFENVTQGSLWPRKASSMSTISRRRSLTSVCFSPILTSHCHKARDETDIAIRYDPGGSSIHFPPNKWRWKKCFARASISSRQVSHPALISAEPSANRVKASGSHCAARCGIGLWHYAMPAAFELPI